MAGENHGICASDKKQYCNDKCVAFTFKYYKPNTSTAEYKRPYCKKDKFFI